MEREADGMFHQGGNYQVGLNPFKTKLPMEFSLKLHSMKIGWSIVYIERSLVIISKKILYFFDFVIGQIKKVLRVTGLKILGRVGTHIFFWKKYNFCILEGISPFKMHKILFFSQKT